VHHQSVDVYVDESGDLGFSRGISSRFLVIAAMATLESDRLGRLTRKARRRFGMTGKTAHEFKFNSSSDRVREYFLRGVAGSRTFVVWRAVDKQGLPERARTRRDLIYRHLCEEVLLTLFKSTTARRINVTIDRRSEIWFRDADFTGFVEKVLLAHHLGYFPPRLIVSRFDSRKSECLQVVDFAVGSIFQKIERENDRYYGLMADRVCSGGVIQ